MAYLDLQGVAWITGAASGIGRSATLAFAHHGIDGMALIDIDAAGLEETRQLVTGKHPDLKILTMAVDIADEAAVQRAVDETVQRFGRIDVGLNDAALGDSVLATHELEVEEYMRIFRTDELGPNPVC